MNTQVRVFDAGLLDGRANIALDQAMIDAHQSNRIGDSLRFIHFRPTALVGRHQDLRAEIDLDHCRANGIGVGRRITGGGAIFLDEGQLGWALALSRETLGQLSLGDVAARICKAAADGLSRLGVTARFRPRNDIEVDGRKISGTGGFHDGDTLFYQGTVLVELDPGRLLGALRVPRAKLEKRQLDSAAQRVVCLRELLGDATPTIGAVEDALLAGFSAGLGLDFVRSHLPEDVLADARRIERDWIGSDAFVAEIDGVGETGGVTAGTHHGPGGQITAYLSRGGIGGTRISQVLLTGDFFVAPPRVVLDLEAHLRNTPLSDLRSNVAHFFSSRSIAAISITADDFCAAIESAARDGPTA